VDIPEERYHGYYNGIANGILWFAHHYLWDIARSPAFDERTARDQRDQRDGDHRLAPA
jgi:trehalose-6-phosphate synthase